MFLRKCEKDFAAGYGLLGTTTGESWVKQSKQVFDLLACHHDARSQPRRLIRGDNEHVLSRRSYHKSGRRGGRPSISDGGQQIRAPRLDSPPRHDSFTTPLTSHRLIELAKEQQQEHSRADQLGEDER